MHKNRQLQKIFSASLQVGWFLMLLLFYLCTLHHFMSCKNIASKPLPKLLNSYSWHSVEQDIVAKRRKTPKQRKLTQLPDLIAFKQATLRLPDNFHLGFSYLILCSWNKAGVLNSVAQKSSERCRESQSLCQSPQLPVVEYTVNVEDWNINTETYSLIYTFHPKQYILYWS